MPRPIWKGFITFGLVNIPVVLYSAIQKNDLRFHLVDSRDKSRIRYVRINEHTGEEVPWNATAKAFEFDKNDYILLDKNVIKELSKKNPRTIEIERFVDTSTLDCTDFETPYYLVPDSKGEKGYVILREIMTKTHKTAITRVMIHTREYLAALLVRGNALMLNLLRYEDEIRKPADFNLPGHDFKKYKITPKEIAVAGELVAAMSGKWEPEKWHDEYNAHLKAWMNKKIRGHKSTRRGKTGKSAEPVGSDNIVNFVDLMKRSMKKSHPKSRTHGGKK